MNKAGKVIALILAAVMIATLIPAAIFAEGPAVPPEQPKVTSMEYKDGKVTYAVNDAAIGSTLIIAGYAKNGRMVSVCSSVLTAEESKTISLSADSVMARAFLLDAKTKSPQEDQSSLVDQNKYEEVLDAHLAAGLNKINETMTSDAAHYADLNMNSETKTVTVSNPKSKTTLATVVGHFSVPENRITVLDSLGEYVGTIQAGSGEPISLNGGHVTREQALQLLKDSGLTHADGTSLPQNSDNLLLLKLTDIAGSAKLVLTDKSGIPVTYTINFPAPKA